MHCLIKTSEIPTHALWMQCISLCSNVSFANQQMYHCTSSCIANMNNSKCFLKNIGEKFSIILKGLPHKNKIERKCFWIWMLVHRTYSTVYEKIFFFVFQKVNITCSIGKNRTILFLKVQFLVECLKHYKHQPKFESTNCITRKLFSSCSSGFHWQDRSGEQKN